MSPLLTTMPWLLLDLFLHLHDPQLAVAAAAGLRTKWLFLFVNPSAKLNDVGIFVAFSISNY